MTDGAKNKDKETLEKEENTIGRSSEVLGSHQEQEKKIREIEEALRKELMAQALEAKAESEMGLDYSLDSWSDGTQSFTLTTDREGTHFRKYDEGKPQMSLVPRKAKIAIARVMEFGAKKYGRDNWRNCTDLRRYEDAAARHLDAHMAGELKDGESGMPHLWHALCCLAFIAELDDAES